MLRWVAKSDVTSPSLRLRDLEPLNAEADVGNTTKAVWSFSEKKP